MASTILTKRQQKVLELLNDVVREGEFYLAGGTALALQLQHRRSIDFDFFTPKDFQPESLRRLLSPPRVVYEARGTLTVMLDEVQVSFFHYPHRLLAAPRFFSGVQVAHPDDLAAMKLSALSSRGSRRDFIDLYFIATAQRPLAECLALFQKKFEATKMDEYHLLKSLIYFEDAETEAMPEMLTAIKWEDVKDFFRNEVKRLAR